MNVTRKLLSQIKKRMPPQTKVVRNEYYGDIEITTKCLWVVHNSSPKHRLQSSTASVNIRLHQTQLKDLVHISQVMSLIETEVAIHNVLEAGR